MDKKKIITYIFDELENEGTIKFNEDKEYYESLKIQQKMSLDLFNFIKKNVHSRKLKKALIPLIENYVDACRDTAYCAFKIYYHQGFIDGIDFIIK